MDNTQRDGKMSILFKGMAVFVMQALVAATLVAGPIFIYLIFFIKP